MFSTKYFTYVNIVSFDSRTFIPSREIQFLNFHSHIRHQSRALISAKNIRALVLYIHMYRIVRMHIHATLMIQNFYCVKLHYKSSRRTNTPTSTTTPQYAAL